MSKRANMHTLISLICINTHLKIFTPLCPYLNNSHIPDKKGKGANGIPMKLAFGDESAIKSGIGRRRQQSAVKSHQTKT